MPRGKPLQRGSGFARKAPLRAAAPAKAETERKLPPPCYLTRTPNYATCTLALPVPEWAS